MIGGTSGSETKLCQPSASQSKSTQTRSASLGSRKTCAPFDPCCLRFSAPFVEKIFKKRSKSSTCVVARIISLPFCLSSAPPLVADGRASVRPSRPGRTPHDAARSRYPPGLRRYLSGTPRKDYPPDARIVHDLEVNRHVYTEARHALGGAWCNRCDRRRQRSRPDHRDPRNRRDGV